MSIFSIKLLAALCMLLDHIGAILDPILPDWLVVTLRLTGRLAMPLFCFCVAEGLFHTRNVKRYLLRLAFFAVLSEVPFDLAFGSGLWDWSQQNVMITLLLGLLGVMLYDMNAAYSNRWLALLSILGCAFAAELLRADYGLFGVYFIYAFYLGRQNNRLLISAMAVGVLALTALQWLGSLDASAMISLMHMGALAVVFRYNGQRGGPGVPAAQVSGLAESGRKPLPTPLSVRLARWGFYAFYPAHLLLLYAIAQLLVR